MRLGRRGASTVKKERGPRGKMITQHEMDALKKGIELVMSKSLKRADLDLGNLQASVYQVGNMVRIDLSTQPIEVVDRT